VALAWTAFLAVHSLIQPWSLPDPAHVHHFENKDKTVSHSAAGRESGR
jgi:hypothetical protein